MDRVVVVTGASAGVGRATAHAFARTGARLGLIARDRAALDDVRAEVERLGGRAKAVAADVADAAAVEAAAAAIEAALGPIAVWVNNAMVTVFGPVERITPAEFRRVTEVTYLGTVHGTMAALKRMRQRGGVIVQVGSALAYRSIPLQAAYCGAKAAIRGFTDSLRSELLHDGSPVRLTMVQLPAVDTPQFDWARDLMEHQPRPVAPVYRPEVIADAIVWAADAGRREVWVGYMTVAAILATRIIPGLLDRWLARTNYRAQQRPGPIPPGRRDNLFQPVGPVHRTHGSFGFEARRSSWQFALSRHRGALALVTAALGAAALAAWASRRPLERAVVPPEGQTIPLGDPSCARAGEARKPPEAAPGEGKHMKLERDAHFGHHPPAGR
jgi:short-subunit dehydrogenase